jgi:hypothetical protein
MLAEAEPPAGFEQRTLERLRADQARVPRPSMMRRLLMVAAIVAAVMIATVAAVRIVDARSSDSSESSSVPVTSARMIGQQGHEAGNAFMTSGSEQYVFVDVDYGVKSGMYRIEALDNSKNATPLGTVAIEEGHGAWAGELPAGGSASPPTAVRVIGPDGRVFCEARFGPVAT